MKKLNLVSIIAFAIVVSSCVNKNKNTDNSSTNSIDSLPETTVEWFAEKVIGGGHNGIINIKEDKLVFSDGMLSGGTLIFDMSTISSTDLSGELKQKLEGHLKSDDFFGVDQFPESVLSIKNVSKNADGKSVKIQSELTIRNITNALEFDAELENISNNVIYKAEIPVDRSKYDVKFGSTSFFKDLGDNAIKNEFLVKVVYVESK